MPSSVENIIRCVADILLTYHPCKVSAPPRNYCVTYPVEVTCTFISPSKRIGLAISFDATTSTCVHHFVVSETCSLTLRIDGVGKGSRASIRLR